MGSLKGKTVLVTGGSRGIGRAICLNLAKEGCHIAFSFLHSEDKAKELLNKIEGFGAKCTADSVDIKDFDKVKTWVDKVKEEFGQINILVNNAGVVTDKALMMMTEENWKTVIDTNLNGMFNASRACVATFMKQKEGHIINISSVSGIIGLPGQTNYSASKGGMNAFTKALAKEVAPFGVRVNAVAPGFIETDIISHIGEEQMKKIKEQIPQNCIGKPEDVANCVNFLLSENASYITGQVIQVDGGLAMR